MTSMELSDISDLLGYAAAGLVLVTFSVRSLNALRSVAIASNLMFIAYAATADLMPVLILHALLLPLNVWRLRQDLTSNPGTREPLLKPRSHGDRVAARARRGCVARSGHRYRAAPEKSAASKAQPATAALPALTAIEQFRYFNTSLASASATVSSTSSRSTRRARCSLSAARRTACT
jgi:hypothetical protein